MGQITFADDDRIDIDIYMKTLVSIALGDDGIVDEKERDFINFQANLHSVNSTDFFNNPIRFDMLNFSDVSLSRETSMNIIRDSITLGHINHDFNSSQKDLVYSLARKINLSNEDVDAIENWLHEYWSILEKGKKLFELA